VRQSDRRIDIKKGRMEPLPHLAECANAERLSDGEGHFARLITDLRGGWGGGGRRRRRRRRRKEWWW
jgi:hypothetical protein